MAGKTSKRSNSKFGVKTLDALGSNFKINYPTITGKLQTSFGGYLTILMGLLSTTMFVIVMSQFFYSNSPIVMKSSEFGSQVNTYDLYKESLYPIITVQMGLKQIRAGQISRFLTIRAYVDEFFMDTNPQAESPFKIVPLNTFDYKPCSQVQDPLVSNYVKEISSQERFDQLVTCPDFRGEQADFKVHENYETTVFRRVSISVFPCSLPDKTQCASAQELGQVKISYGYPFKVLEPSNRTHPMKSAPVMRGSRIDIRSVEYSQQIITKNRVMDDTLSTLTPATLNLEFATMNEESLDFSGRDPSQLHCSEQQIRLRYAGGCTEYLMFEYHANKEVIITRRSYKKITTMLGEFGGLFKILTSMIFVFYGLYSMRKVKTELGNLIFGEDKTSRTVLKRLVEADDSHTFRLALSKITEHPEVEGIQDEKSSHKLEIKGSSTSSKGPSMEDLVQSLVKKRSRVDDLMKKLGLLDLIEKALLSDSEKTLLPLVLLKAEKSEFNREEEEKISSKGENLFKKKNLVKNNKNRIFLKKKATNLAPGQKFKEAYEDLVSQNPDCKFSQIIKEYMISKLEGTFSTKPGIFEEEKIQKKIQISSKNEDEEENRFTKFNLMESRHQIEPTKEQSTPINTPAGTTISRQKSKTKYMRPTDSPIRIKTRFSSGFKKKRAVSRLGSKRSSSNLKI